jgi:2-methylisocitrate lyase-like PEP mutase family enzyme
VIVITVTVFIRDRIDPFKPHIFETYMQNWLAFKKTGASMAVSTKEKREAFRKLHESGCFVLPNPWDIGSARLLQHLGFKALASTSSGYAWSTGRPDNGVGVNDVIDHLTMLCGATDLPLNADFESGFSDSPEGVGINVTRAVATGVAGLSIEDSTGDASRPLFDEADAVARIKAARAAIDKDSSDVILVGRCEGFLVGHPDLGLVIARLQAYSDAGADCLYAPGIKTKSEISAVVKALHPKPINMLIGGAGSSVQIMADLGVRRISVGGALARVAWGGFIKASREIAEQGTFGGLANAIPFADLNGMFAGND